MNAIASKPIMLAILEPATQAPRKRFWTAPEITSLRLHYPKLGLAGCLPLFPGRSGASIYQHAAALGLKSPSTKAERQNWSSSEFIDAAIKRAYQGTPYKGLVRDLAITVGRPRHWVSDRATRLGLKFPRFREPQWTQAETELLEQHAHKDPATISRLMRKHGFSRSAVACQVKRKRLSLTSIDPNHFTATSFAGLMGVDSKVVTSWIAKGWLIATRRGTERTESQGGDMWWIKRSNARLFIINSVAMIDLRKVEKFMFVDLLAEKASA